MPRTSTFAMRNHSSRSLVAAIIVAICALLATAGPYSAREATHEPSKKLFVVSFLSPFLPFRTGTMATREARLDALVQLGVAGDRLGFDWSRIERTRGLREWAEIDSVVSALQARGLRGYGMLVRSPTWARPSGAPAFHRPTVSGSAALGDDAFAAFAADAARRYRGRVDRWVIWNEPNAPTWWANSHNGQNAGPDPEDYVHLFQVARDSIERANPDALVVSAGLAASLGRRRPIRDPMNRQRTFIQLPPHEFLRGFASVARPRHVGLHVYSEYPPGQRAPGQTTTAFPDVLIDSVFAVLDAAGLHESQVLVDEWGVNQSSGRTDEFVHDWFVRAARTMLCHPRISGLTVYALTTPPELSGFALVDGDGRLTATGRALRQVARDPQFCQ